MKKTFIPKHGFLERKPFSGINCVSGMGGLALVRADINRKKGRVFTTVLPINSG